MHADGAGAHEHPQGEEQGVAGQEEADEQTGLGEDDEHDADDGPGAEPFDDRRDEIGGVEPLGAEHRGVGGGEGRKMGGGQIQCRGQGGQGSHRARLSGTPVVTP